jgi:hypothetical protein
MNHSTASASLAEAFEPRSETDTRLYGYWLVRLLCLTWKDFGQQHALDFFITVNTAIG